MRRALSPVVASIILIAVTVAVSIAVAAWMNALSFSFMGKQGPPNIRIVPDLKPHSINISITNNGPAAIYPSNLLINNETVWPAILIDKLPVGSSRMSLINYNWTYNTVYTYTLVWWGSNPDGSRDKSKELNLSTSISSPPETFSMVLPIPEFNTFPPPHFANASFAVWEWDYYDNHFPQFKSNMTLLPANMTIDVTTMNVGTLLTIKVHYYQLARPYQPYPDPNFALFEHVGEKDFLLSVEKRSAT